MKIARSRPGSGATQFGENQTAQAIGGTFAGQFHVVATPARHIEQSSSTGSLLYGALQITSRVGSPRSVLPNQAPKTADQWVSRHQDKLKAHKGKWVAVTSKGIVATSTDFDGVYAAAEKQGATDPLVFKVPNDRTYNKFVSVRRR